MPVAAVERATRATSPTSGLAGVYSHVSKRSSSSSPEIRSARRDELRRGDRVTGLPVGPRADDAEEVVVADLEAQRVQRHRAAVVHGDVEQQLRPRVTDDHGPERVVGRDHGHVEVEDLLGRPQSLALAPQPLGVGGEALVEPDVLPQPEAEVVAEPLVRQLVHDHALGGDRVGEPVEGVDRPGLVLQREAEALQVVDDAAGGAERVLTEVPGEEVDDLRLAGERRRGDVPWCRGQVGLRPDDPVVVVARAARGWAGDGPAVERIVVVLERGAALTRSTPRCRRGRRLAAGRCRRWRRRARPRPRPPWRSRSRSIVHCVHTGS